LEIFVKAAHVNGEMVLLKDAGNDVSQENIKPWAFRNDGIQIFDKDGASSILTAKYFRVKDTLFMDVIAESPNMFGIKINQWWRI